MTIIMMKYIEGFGYNNIYQYYIFVQTIKKTLD
jgi:hypothetical protein